MDGQRGPGAAHSATFADGLLVAVLADVGDPELGEGVDVGRGEELRDDDERHVVGAPGGEHRLVDPGPDRPEPLGELVAAPAHPATRCTIPANRPVVRAAR